MKKIVFVLLTLSLVLLAPPRAEAEELPETVSDPLTEDAKNFTPYGGTWVYQDGAYSQLDDLISGTSWNYGSHFPYAYADFTVAFEMKLNAVGEQEGYAGIMFRKAKPDDTLEMSGYAVVLKSYGQVAVYDWSKTKVMSSLPLADPYGWHSYKIENIGKKLKLYIDGEIRQSISDGAYTEGFLALTTGTASASFRNFTIAGEALGTAGGIGVIGDGNMDMEASDTIFGDRAAIEDSENGTEPAWFAAMIGKLGGKDADAEEAEAEVVMSGAEEQTGGVRTATLAVAGVAAVLLVVALLLFFANRKGGRRQKGAAAAALLLALTLGAAPVRAAAGGNEVFDGSAFETVFYVSPSGDDGNPGTSERPFQSIRKAQEAVARVVTDQKGDVAVVLREGRYAQGSPLVFDEDDSGKNGFRVVYMSYPGELVSVSGGVKIEGWEEAGSGVWKAETTLNLMRQLYVDGTRAVLARSSRVPYEISTYDKTTQTFIVNAEDVEGITGGELCTYMDWKFSVSPIASIDGIPNNPYGKAIKLNDFATNIMQTFGDLLDFNCKYFIQNDKALLDEPGEFYFDRGERTVYYMPRAGEDMRKASVFAPGVESLVKVAGGDPRSHVSNLTFRGLVFEHSGYNKLTDIGLLEYQANHFFTEYNGTPYSPMDVPSATIHVENADNIRIERCVIRRSGGCGINLYPSVSGSVIDGCVVTDISGNGITVSPYCSNKYTSDELYSPTKPELTGVRNIDVTNNVITWTGQEFKAACALANILGFEIVMRNNEIAFAPYTGISNGWGWSTRDYAVKENTVAYNDIHHIGMNSVDTAGYYNLNAQKGTQIRNNYIHDIQKAGTGRAGAPVFAIYLDEGSNHLVVTGNSVKNAPENQDDIIFHNTGGKIYSLGNDVSDEVIGKAGVGEAYRSISLKKYASAGTSLTENVSLGQPGAPFDGEIGMKLTAREDVNVTALGRFCLTGNVGVHRLTLYDAKGKVVAQTLADMSKGTADYNGFKYAELSRPVRLKAGASYFLSSEETKDGDWWLERMCKVIPNEAFAVDGSLTKTEDGFDIPSRPGAGYTAGPVNLLFEKG
ncbi:MAG: right-handed parallel beta-helix repeat-containing protein [Clostridiales Family XIII bacterium]|jgi:hypothetical protein|nr:right-handed parallel beta-helix repeat-containing protein [Clostridiales Family XIII bacterium]